MVRLLVGSDFHRGPLASSFGARLGEDVVPLFLGDLVNRPCEEAGWFHEVARAWAARNPDLVVVPGNHDPEDAGSWDGVQVHARRGLTILSVPVIPILYKIPSWTREVSERRIAEMLAPFRGRSYDVIASHAPPHGACDRAVWGARIGSRALREFAGAVDFGLWLCGHVHEGRATSAEVCGRPVWNAARAILDLETDGRLATTP